MQPDHHRALPVVVDSRGPEIDSQTVLAGYAVVPLEHKSGLVVCPTRAGSLRTDPSEIERASHTGPWLWLCRRHESTGFSGRGRIRDTFEGVNPVARES